LFAYRECVAQRRRAGRMLFASLTIYFAQRKGEKELRG
jgi:hypothetical protein